MARTCNGPRPFRRTRRTAWRRRPSPAAREGESACFVVSQRLPSGRELQFEYTTVKLRGGAGFIAIGKSVQAAFGPQVAAVAASRRNANAITGSSATSRPAIAPCWTPRGRAWRSCASAICASSRPTQSRRNPSASCPGAEFLPDLPDPRSQDPGQHARNGSDQRDGRRASFSISPGISAPQSARLHAHERGRDLLSLPDGAASRRRRHPPRPGGCRLVRARDPRPAPPGGLRGRRSRRRRPTGQSTRSWTSFRPACRAPSSARTSSAGCSSSGRPCPSISSTSSSNAAPIRSLRTTLYGRTRPDNAEVEVSITRRSGRSAGPFRAHRRELASPSEGPRVDDTVRGGVRRRGFRNVARHRRSLTSVESVEKRRLARRAGEVRRKPHMAAEKPRDQPPDLAREAAKNTGRDIGVGNRVVGNLRAPEVGS